MTPQAAPKPALQYQLLPELREMNPGNPIQGYLVCFMEQNHFFYDKEAVENREKWQTMPLKDLPVKELHGYGGGALRQADYAARLDTPDWQILLKMRRDGVNTLLPDVQEMRLLAAALKVRFRAEVAERRFDDALATAKTMFALSRHLGEHPTLIGDLVGVAVASLTVGPVEEMIQQPGCPNLYWALTDLPAPFIDLSQGATGRTGLGRGRVPPSGREGADERRPDQAGRGPDPRAVRTGCLRTRRTRPPELRSRANDWATGWPPGRRMRTGSGRPANAWSSRAWPRTKSSCSRPSR